MSKTPDRRVGVPRARTAVVLMAVGALLFVSAALLVHAGATVWDERIFRAVNEVPSDVASILTPLSRLFLPLGVTIVIAATAVFVTMRNRSWLPLLVGVSAGGFAWLLSSAAKAAAERPRPYEAVAGAILRQDPAHGTSFPSIHTAVALATAIALVPFLSRRLACVAIAYAILIAWSRMYLGVHYPLDVIGGAGIGLAVGGLAILAAARFDRVDPGGAGGPRDGDGEAAPRPA